MTQNEDFQKLTTENMVEYTKFQKAAAEYATFLIKVRKLEWQNAKGIMDDVNRMVVNNLIWRGD
jgi:hypothetical protein